MISPVHAAILALSLLAPPEEPRQPGASQEPAPAGGIALAPEVAGPARRYQIQAIRFDGLRQVREGEARRHLLFGPGELLDEERVLFSRLKLLQLGWFSKVETRVERGTERGLVVVV